MLEARVIRAIRVVRVMTGARDIGVIRAVGAVKVNNYY